MNNDPWDFSSKPLADLSREDRFRIGNALIERREDLQQRATEIKWGCPENLNVYDIIFQTTGDGGIHVDALSAADAHNYTAEMKAASKVRCLRLHALMRELLNEQLAEIESVLEQL